MSELKDRRVARALSQSDLAQRVGLSRQGYAAIEAGKARPSVDVALRLAIALDTTVEVLFRATRGTSGTVVADFVGAAPRPWPVPVRLAQVGGRMLAFATSRVGGAGMGLADGLAEPEGERRVSVELFASRPKAPDLVVMGCDPSFALVAEMLRRERGIEVLWIQTGSRAALEALARGEAHVAGVHLQDPDSGVYNTPWVERYFARGADVVHFASWEQSLLLAPGNPRGIERASDLARPDIRFVNREAGSGSRSLLERWLGGSGVDGADIPGYATTHAGGHMEVAAAVAAGAADAGVGIRAAGNLFGLESVLLAAEPYDLVVLPAAVESPGVRSLFDVLQRPELARQIEALGGYDVSAMGRPA